ncbi:MAG: GWxTD domain-containing protein [Gemmatimonadetes bacterium]|nr:GWxTD domain-containing protein [Gemmatimonadota bacterium]
MGRSERWIKLWIAAELIALVLLVAAGAARADDSLAIGSESGPDAAAEPAASAAPDAVDAVPDAEDEITPPRPDEDRFFRVILDEVGQKAYDATPPHDRPAFQRRYWAEHDPTPTTLENQAEVEHMRRVQKAIKRFRDRKGRFAWDDRAQFFIRFGEPLRIETFPGYVAVHEGVIGAKELWLYKDMLVWLQDVDMQGIYHVILDPDRKYSGIGKVDGGMSNYAKETDQLLAELEDRFEMFVEANDLEIDPTQARQMSETGLHRFGETPTINVYDYEGAKEFGFIFDVASLAGADGKTDLLLGFLVPLTDVAFEPDESTFKVAKLQRRVSLKTPEFEEVATKVANLEHRQDPLEPAGGWMVTAESLSVDPGGYTLAMRFIDVRTQNHGILKTGVEARYFAPGRFAVSDIVFASSVTRDNRAGGAFLRGQYRIVPRPVRIYAPGEDVTVYFELYNLAQNSKGRGNYEVKYSLFGTKVQRFTSFFGGNNEGMLEPVTSQTFENETVGPTASRHISLDTTTLPNDRYTLIIEATDMKTGETDMIRAQFVIKGK